MKKHLLISTLSIFVLTIGISQQIHHVDFGEEGLVVEINEAYPMDIDSDGTIDFYINSWPDELGFTPVTEIGCFSSPSSNAQTSWGSRMLSIFDEGEVIGINFDNINDYIDDDRGSIHKNGVGLAAGWTNAVPHFIGLAVFNNDNGTVTNGWLKVKVDEDNSQLIILEYAYHDFVDFFYASEYNMVIGDNGLVNTENIIQLFSEISISPNPASDLISIDYNYQGKGDLNISIFDSVGKEVKRSSAHEQSSLVLDSSNWPEGVYFVNFNTSDGHHTERIMINH